jgi:thiol:disulfide interchange protein DsbC
MKRNVLSTILLSAMLCVLPARTLWAQGMSSKPATPATSAASAAEDNVKKQFIERFGAVGVDGVTRTPYGLYEIRIGSNLIYTDEKVSFVLDGNLIDAATKKNVTQERIEKLLAVNFDDLPLKLAVKQVRGNGSRRMALFEDPNCGYCKQLRHSMQGIDNVTIYTFLYPILAADSASRSRDVWCSPDKAKAWEDWMLNGKAPATGNCDAPLQAVLALGKKLQVTGTPTIFFGDNTRVGGAIPADQLRAKLDSMSKKS